MRIDRMLTCVLLYVVTLFSYDYSAQAALFTLFDDRGVFEANLGAMVVDDYENPAYEMGDKTDNITLDIFTNAGMSDVIGETDYNTTGFDNHNIIFRGAGDSRYCAGCNGSYELGFTTTSVGSGLGVYGAGWDIRSHSDSLPYSAFVTFGTGMTMNLALPTGTDVFFGITSPDLIRSIHFGLADGVSTREGSYAIDNLTIGSRSTTTPVPEPITAALGVTGLCSLLLMTRRRDQKG